MDISGIRRDYDGGELKEEDLPPTPKPLFDQWLEEAFDAGIRDANSMVLSTVDPLGSPSSRIVLAKEVDRKGFYFYTNYDSRKGIDLASNPRAALLFHWAQLDRVVRAEGRIERVTDAESDAYFKSRPHGSQLGAIASPQSRVIPSRQYLSDRMAELEAQGGEVKRPNNWGGYLLRPRSIEFWQGRPDRLHDRIRYRVHDGAWVSERLAP
ncbi:MAG: pyridoxamine 5'-phosphate oxidase [Flaviflexus sp.]|uniref:pyridoxamine 5'-phosphate oxidase n=1 Tax=Flaviflexus sp. TaxID=1969482 RepID=UPI00352F8915